MNNKNGKSLLAAIIAIAMVVCALAVVLPPDVSAEGTNYEVSSTPENGQYKDIPEAISAAESAGVKDIIITLVDDVTGAGFITDAGQNVTIDLNKHTYTVNKAVGSSGTETNGMQLLENSDVTLRNGTVNCTAGSGVQLLIQNYSDLKLDSVVLDCDNLTGAMYAISNNCGNSVITGNTIIDTKEGGVAFDVYGGFGSYESVSVTIDENFTGSIAGEIEISEQTSGHEHSLVVNANVTIDNLDAQNGSVTIGSGASVTIASGTIGTEMQFTNNGTMIVPSGSTIINNGTITNSADARINAYGSITGGTINNNGTIAVLSENASIDSTMSGNGSVDTSAVSENATLSGRLLTSTTFTDRQTVTVTDNLTLVKGTVLTIEGTLVIPEGMTVTVEDGAQLIINGQSATVENNGNIIIQSSMGYVSGQTTITNLVGTVFGFAVYGGATVENNGTINAQYLPASVLPVDSQVVYIGADSVLENNAQVVIGTESAIAIEGSFTNTASATFDMSGTIMSGTIDNAGIVNINGASNANIHINLTVVDAVANIVAVTGTQNSAGTYVSGSGYITVQDVGFKSPNAKNEYANVDDVDSVMVYAAEGFTAGGITVKAMTYTDDVNSDGKDETYKALDISGTYTVSATNGDVDKSSSVFRIYGENLFVTDSLNVGAGVSMNFGPYNGTSSTTNLTVSGTMNVTVAASASSTSTFNLGATGTVNVYVTGQIDSLTNLAADTYNLNMNAASYTTIANAITTYHYTTLENAVASGATTIDVYGKITVNGEVEIASGVTVRQDAGSKIDISTTGYVTVADGGRIQGVNVDVSGSLYAANERTGLLTISSILSEVRSTNGTDALYTNLVNAMADAESGDTIELYTKDVELRGTNFTIKEGVTVDTKGKTFSVYGTNLRIDGTLFINGDDTDYIVENNVISGSYSQPSTVTLNGYIKTAYQTTFDDSKYPAGAYYSMLESGTEYYYITTVANAAAVINDVEENTVTIEGKLAMGTVSFIGTEDEQAIVNIASNAEVTSGNVTLDNARLNVISGAQFTATVTDGNGSVDVKIVSQEETSATAAPSFSENIEDGFVVGDNASGAEMTFNGTVIVTDLTVSKMTVEGTVTIDGTSTSVTETLQINGTVTVQNGVLTATNAKTFVNGELTAIEATADSEDVGNVDLGDTYVGIGLGDDEKTLVDGNAGTIVGNVVATIAYVSSDSTVPEDMISGDNVKSTQFYVDDALWMTAYTADASANKANVPNAPVTDAKFIGWDDTEGNTVYYSNPTGQQAGTSDIVVGSYDGKLYASIEYNVYNVQIIADSSIGSVAIDGVILAKNMLGYYATTEPLTAGQHTVTYTLAAGYEGTATLSSTNTEVSGMTFTLSGDFEETVYVLTIGGATYAGSTVVIEGGNNGGSDMGLTDYLLIVLVILIVIMAIIVALRLMRS